MLFYSSLHPEWDYTTPTVENQLLQISEALDTVSLNHYRSSRDCFDMLERQGIFLGNGAFLVAMLQPDPEAPLWRAPLQWPQTVTAAAKAALHAPLWYCYTVAGRLYILLCFPRLPEQDPAVPTVLQEIYHDFDNLAAQLLPLAPALRILVSDFQFDAAGIFRCFNALHHALDYYNFRSKQETVIRLDTERALHGAFADDLNLYRQLSIQVAELLGKDTEADIAGIICDRIISGSAPTIESIHNHIQLFMLTFTDYLGSSGMVDSSYIKSHKINYRAFEFETEADLRRNMQTLVAELKKQHRVLRAVGRQQRIQSIREYIEQNISVPSLTVGLLSERFGISTTQLGKQFRYYYGLSPYQFLQKTRLLEAQALIRRHPDWPLSKIAEAAGYSDLSTMYRAFQRHGDVTPGAFKETVQAGHMSTVMP